MGKHMPRTIHDILLSPHSLRTSFPDERERLLVIRRDKVDHSVAILVLNAAPNSSDGSRPATDYRGNSQGVSTSIEQALHDRLSQLWVLNLHGEVQRCRALYAVDRVHVALLMREDVLEHVGVP